MDEYGSPIIGIGQTIGSTIVATRHRSLERQLVEQVILIAVFALAAAAIGFLIKSAVRGVRTLATKIRGRA
jgi:hypothetical protein